MSQADDRQAVARRGAPTLPLGRWFLLWMVLVTVFVLGLSVAVVTLHQRASLRHQLEMRSRSVARTLAFSRGDPGSSSFAVTAVPECVSVAVSAADGSLLWRFGLPPEEALEVDPWLLAIEETWPATPARDAPGGRVLMLVSPAQIRAQVAATGARLAVTLTFALAVALVIGVFLLNGVVEPLKRLADCVRSFRAEEPTAVPVAGGGALEVNELTQAFQQMSERLALQRQSLLSSERRFRELVMASPTPILEVDAGWRVQGANPAAELFLGADIDPDGLDVRSVFDPRDPTLALPEPREDGDEALVDGSWRLPDGERAEVELHVRRVQAESGAAFLTTVHDLTDRQRRVAERWRRTFDEMNDGVALVDSRGAVSLANRAMAPLVDAVAPGLAERAGVRDRQEWRADAEGRVLQCSLSAAAGTDARVLVVRDISDWMAAEARLREAQKIEAVATLAGGVAHDFNNLLAGVLLHVRLLDRDRESRHQAAEAIRVLAEEGAEVVRGLLQFARPEASPRRGVDVAALVCEQEALLRHMLPATVRLSVAAPSRPATVLGSSADLRRILVNLVLNARDAMAEGGGCVTVAVGGSAEQVILEVADTGPGIPADCRERIFEPFFTLRRGGRGAGIGLAVVYAIVREHDGEISVGSTAEGGALLTVRLPGRPDLTAEGDGEDAATGAGELRGEGEAP